MKLLQTTLLVSGFLMTMSCERSNLNSNLVSAEENSNAENAFNIIFQEVDETMKEQDAAFKIGSADTCKIVTKSGTEFPKTITIDFQEGCTKVINGTSITKKGKIIINQSAPYKTTGSVLTVTLEDFYVNDVQLMGSKSIANNGRNADSNLTYSVVVSGGKMLTDGTTTSWASTRTNEWKTGEATPFNIFDDEYTITGSANGTNKNSEDYTVSITEPLLKKIGCRWITKGGLSIKIEDKDELSLDYGDGNCDNKAIVTFKDKTKEITLRR